MRTIYRISSTDRYALRWGDMPHFPNDVYLSSLNGDNGFKISGEAAYDHSGWAVATAGDVNGDGFADVIVSAFRATPNGPGSGAVYVLFGKASGFSANVDLSSLSGANGFKISGQTYGLAGWSVASAGDANGDGFDDLIIGAPGSKPHGSSSGATYVVFGKATGFGANLDLSNLASTNGFVINGESQGDVSGSSVASAGDVNGDGFADLIIGADRADPHGTYSAGAVYIVFGKASDFGSSLDLSTLTGPDGFQINGVAQQDRTGFSVATAGDFNGDGFADVVIGAYRAAPNDSSSGASYVVFGKASGFSASFDLSSLTGSNGFRISGSARAAESGFSVASAGDTNGDGYADIIIGAPYGGPHRDGASYVVFGAPSGFTADFDVSNLNGTNGFRISGAYTGDLSGWTVSTAGDINGDGFDDLLIGAKNARPYGSQGASYVVFGKAAGFSANFDLSTLSGPDGVRIDGSFGAAYSNRPAALAGDVNGDGVPDIIIGASYASPHGQWSGASYVVFGRVAATDFTGTASSETLVGSDFNDTLTALAGNDTLFGHGGDDSLDGGLGNDSFDGGDGGDTAIFSGPASSYGAVSNGIGTPITITGPDGTDSLSNIEFLQFADSIIQATAFSAALDLSTFNNDDGYQIGGLPQPDGSGSSVASAGDVNSDGFIDMIIGAPYASPHGYWSGASHVVFGKAEGFQTDIDLSNLSGPDGFKISGEVYNDHAGSSLASAGDVNGDGFADLIVGAWGARWPSGASYLVFGKASGFGSNLDLSSLNGANGFKLSGGSSVAGAGDVNNDGFADVIIGARNADAHGTDSGAAYVVLGDVTGAFPANVELSNLNGSDGFKISGEASQYFTGGSVASAGDVNGDGFADLIIGASFASPHGSLSGAAYVVFGKSSGFGANIDLSGLNGANGFKLSGHVAISSFGERTGYSVASAGDFNGDGFDDVIIGAPFAGFFSGASYLVFGKASGFDPNIDLSGLNGANGFAINGAAQHASSGRSVASAGDLNGDGFDDVIIGAPYEDSHGSNTGAAYVVFGKASDFGPTFDLARLNGANGFSVVGKGVDDETGASVAPAGDVNGDGLADLLVGSPGSTHGSASGSVTYVVYGRPSNIAVDLTGTVASQNLVGSNFDDTLSGLAGADTLFGHGGNDSLDGGDGIDTAVFSGARSTYAFSGFGIGASHARAVIGPDGTASLSNIEFLEFADGIVPVTPFPAALDLSSLDGANGFKISGETAYDRSGWVVGSAGDVNGDGFADLIIGADGADPHGGFSGVSYVVFGKGSAFDSTLDLSTLSGIDGLQISGVAVGDRSGFSVASAGDVNGDDFADLIIGAYTADPHGSTSGASYVVFGKAAGFAGNLDLSSLTGDNGFRINGEVAYDQSGFSVASAGDVNGDGYADLIIGAKGADPHGDSSGASYVVFGKASGFGGNLDLSSLTGDNGFKIRGEAAGDFSGISVASAGDVNGDGFADLIIGASGADPHGADSGASYVVFGKSSGFAPNLDLSGLTDASGFQISGEVSNDRSGRSVASAGDINGDGFADLIIGAYRASPHGRYSGASYVVFGAPSSFGANLDLSTLIGANGFQVGGKAADDQAGFSVASAGDINGDGFGDLIVGAWSAGSLSSGFGASYVAFGRASGFGATLELSTLSGTDGFQLDGEAAYDFSGRSVASAGDVNGDGLGDLIIGANGADPHGSFSGASYVVFGRMSEFAVNLTGTVASQTLVGSNFGDMLSALAGNDMLFGHAGNDSLDAGSGDDLLDGGDDIDVASFSTDASGVNANLLTGTATGAASGHDVLLAIEYLAGGSGGDTLTGSTNANSLAGNEGNDLLMGGSGNDTLAGGAGVDIAMFSGPRSAYTITLTLNNGATVFGPDGTDTLSRIEKAAFSDGTFNIRTQATDLDGDGNSDFLWQLDNGQPAAWLMNGATVTSGGPIHYPNLTPTDPGTAWHVKGSGDFNSDAKADIVFQHDNGMPAIWLIDGLELSSGGYIHYVDLTPTDPGIAWHVMGSGDFNSDGNADLLFQHDNGMPAIWLINGFQLTSGGYIHYPDLSPTNPGTSWHVKGSADFNGDGNADVLWQDDAGNPAIWLVNGFALSSGGYIHNPDLSPANLGGGWHIKGAGDFDGNGKADVFWQHDDGRAAIWLIDGFALVSSTVLTPNPGVAWQVQGAGDYNGDGKSDILWQSDSAQPMVWLMDGTTTLESDLVGTNPGPTWHLDWI